MSSFATLDVEEIEALLADDVEEVEEVDDAEEVEVEIFVEVSDDVVS